MKKLLSAALFSLCMYVIRTAAFADAALPPPGYRFRAFMETALAPIIIAVVIIAVVVLVKVLRSRKK